ncbi:MAG: hypothetical protein KGH72_02255 [Candidatus Micrarchaeota archaeon]|nr:hypothetical protein [Candidatus Micrarchaeota archaeon]
MANEQQPVNINMAKSKLKPVFADEVGIVLKVKANKNEKGDVEKEGHVELIFLDMVKQQPIGEYILSKSTAKALVGTLSQSLINLDKELANKSMPKQPEIKTTGDASYIR